MILIDFLYLTSQDKTPNSYLQKIQKMKKIVNKLFTVIFC